MEQHPMGWDAWGEPLCVPPTQGTFSVHRFGVKHPKKHPGVGGPQAAMGQRCAYGTLGGAAPRWTAKLGLQWEPPHRRCDLG